MGDEIGANVHCCLVPTVYVYLHEVPPLYGRGYICKEAVLRMYLLREISLCKLPRLVIIIAGYESAAPPSEHGSVI